MNIYPSNTFMAICVALLAAFPGRVANAGERRFEPVPQSGSQRVQVVNDAKIISAMGKRISAGASIAGASARRVWLSVSVKNTGTESVGFDDGAILVVSAGEPLALSKADKTLDGGKGDLYVRDSCANATSSSQMNCNIDWFNKRQAHPQASASLIQLAPGQLLAQRFQLAIPKRTKGSPTTLSVSVTVAGEILSFAFRETN